MNCENLRIENEDNKDLINYFCKLKESNEANKTMVNMALFNKGIQPEVNDEICPLAETGLFEQCPFRK